MVSSKLHTTERAVTDIHQVIIASYTKSHQFSLRVDYIHDSTVVYRGTQVKASWSHFTKFGKVGYIGNPCISELTRGEHRVILGLCSPSQPSSHQSRSRSRTSPAEVQVSPSTFGAQARIAFPGELLSSWCLLDVELEQTVG